MLNKILNSLSSYANNATYALSGYWLYYDNSI